MSSASAHTPWENKIRGYGTADPRTITPHPLNWRRHGPEQLDAIEGSLDELGWIQDVIINQTTGHLLDGHARVEKALSRGEASVPVKYVALSEEEELLALLTFDPISAMATSHHQHVQALVSRVAPQNAALRSVVATLAAHNRMVPPAHLTPRTHTRTHGAKAATTFDMIFTYNGYNFQTPFCCVAICYGWWHGVQSLTRQRAPRLCPHANQHPRHHVAFLDCDYAQYDHAHHLATCQALRPKYVTVRDIMTEQQCSVANIPYWPLDAILAWAAELAPYADQVILIPKYDCLDALPPQYILGYSVPTSHGGTPLPLAAFTGRQVHLLGGSWKQQLTLLEQYGDLVVSADNNYILLQAQYGGYVLSDGTAQRLDRPLLLPLLIALTLSFDAITARLCELYPEQARLAETLHAPADAYADESARAVDLDL
jgi:hypothetical protein